MARSTQSRGADSQRNSESPLVALNDELSRWSRWADLRCHATGYEVQNVTERWGRSHWSMHTEGSGAEGEVSQRKHYDRREITAPGLQSQETGKWTRADFKHRAKGSNEA